ncbi:oxidoreductase [Streptomyces sp. HNM0645]|uniref:oxidoreductase n=1 Tax=Streptomyces sp. HNM0645 TaxID=2782343 RepID=UPI0024B770E2|nr:oxidoreductase [Streptomyces sp. HNM0645]MDI9885379.1 oxidoreductase [Streptomyces sp. HNM0645]
MIPLRPLDLGDVLVGAFASIGRGWKQLYGTAVAVYLAAVLLVGGAIAVAYSAVGDRLREIIDLPRGGEPSWAQVQPLVVAFVCVWAFALVVMLLSTAVVTAAVPAVLQDTVLGRPVVFGAVWRRAWERVPAVLGTVLLTGLIGLVPMALLMAVFVALMVGLSASLDGDANAAGGLAAFGFLGVLATAPVVTWLWVKFSLAPHVAVFEGQGPVRSMRRSWDLVRGGWWRIFGISLLGYLMAAAAGFAIREAVDMASFVPMAGTGPLRESQDLTTLLVGLSGWFALALVGQLVAQIVTSTFPQLVTGLLYVDQRIRNENLAPVLASAAGGAGPHPPAPPVVG